MAIYTAAKRASVLSFNTPWAALVIPDGTIGQGDRQTIADSYAGISSGAPPAPGGSGNPNRRNGPKSTGFMMNG